ncbi:MAG: hypothetical protein HY901_36090 [Deltaproteobacteria bacterium]|nr:hypothetical protein [Deltaproteobacteria bacterium]
MGEHKSFGGVSVAGLLGPSGLVRLDVTAGVLTVEGLSPGNGKLAVLSGTRLSEVPFVVRRSP